MRPMRVAVFLILGSAIQVQADPFDEFKQRAQDSYLKPFAEDFGGLIGATDFHSARVPGLGGFDAGVVGSLQPDPSDDNAILKDAGIDLFGLPLVRVEAGLPVGLGLFVRGVSAYGATILGGGLRYQIYKSGLVMAIPDVAVTLGYDKLDHDVLDMEHTGGSVQASFNLPVIQPFLGIGYDSTKLTVKEPAAIAGLSATGKGVRLTGGASITLFPFTYLFGGYSILHGEPAYEIGLGARFGGVL